MSTILLEETSSLLSSGLAPMTRGDVEYSHHVRDAAQSAVRCTSRPDSNFSDLQ